MNCVSIARRGATGAPSPLGVTTGHQVAHVGADEAQLVSVGWPPVVPAGSSCSARSPGIRVEVLRAVDVLFASQ
eukprot:396765-Pyramimonas_sp.AAC.1